MNRRDRRKLKSRESKGATRKLRAPAATESDPAVLRQYGDELVKAQQFESAASAYRKAIDLDPGHARTWTSLGFVLTRLRRRDEAIPCYEQAHTLAPDDIEIAHDLAALLHGDQRHAEAAALLEQVLDARPDLPEAQFNMAQCRAVLGQKDESIAHYKACIRAAKNASALQPGNANLPLTAGKSLANMGLHLDAIEWYRQALAIDARNLQANYYMGKSLGQVGRYDEAETHLRQAITRYPGFLNAHRTLASLYMQCEQHEKAAACMRQILKLDPEDAECQHFLGAMRPGKAPENSPRDYVVNLFNSYADRFDDHLVGRLKYRGPQLLRDAVTPLVSPGRPNGTIVDLGCGTGLCGPLFRDIAETLVGVDLSPDMLTKAEGRGVYDRLECDDVVDAALAFDGTLSGVVAADVLVYIGRLDPLFSAVSRALVPGGWFAFTTEIARNEPYELTITGRYAHRASYLREMAAEHSLEVMVLEDRVGRFQNGEPVQVNVAAMRRRS